MLSRLSLLSPLFACSLTLLHRIHATSERGNEACRCLERDFVEVNSERFFDSQLVDIRAELGPNIDLDTYGYNCAPHDQDSLACSNTNCHSMIPIPPDCDKSYCGRSWCYVDGSKCALTHKPSTLFQGQYYSYATCGELDRFTHTERLKSLQGQLFKVGFTANSGGWKGSFNPYGSFAINNKWNGPIVDFIKEAAMVGGFTINMTSPPDWITPFSREFFGSSSFDLCVYATSLGFLDFCIGGYTISEKRSSVTTMLELTNDPFYLIVFAEGGTQTDWETFKVSATTIFRPFTIGSWAVIILFALPILGLLFLFHEYDAPGSAFPRSEPVLIKNENGEVVLVKRPISILKHAGSAVYTGFLAYFEGSYNVAVVTPGGKTHLLAMASFVILILSVFTANLASILTLNARKTSVDNFDMAVRQGYNFCAERKLAEFIIDSYGVNPELFVPDPLSLGGDGKPGFETGKVRQRVYEQMRVTHSDNTLYCNAAISKIEDLQKMQSYGEHCDKTKVGESLGQSMIGIPIFDRRAPALSLLFHKLKENGSMTRSLLNAVPTNQCPVEKEVDSALSIQELTGIWVITFGFAFVALVVKCMNSKTRHSKIFEKNVHQKLLRRSDQWLMPPGHAVVVDGYRYDPDNNEAEPVEGDQDLLLKEESFFNCRNASSFLNNGKSRNVLRVFAEKESVPRPSTPLVHLQNI